MLSQTHEGIAVAPRTVFVLFCVPTSFRLPVCLNEGLPIHATLLEGKQPEPTVGSMSRSTMIDSTADEGQADNMRESVTGEI